MKRECQSLSSAHPSEIILSLRLDGNTNEAVRGVLFRVTPEAWPSAVSNALPLVHVDKIVTKVKEAETKEEKTWDDLRREGATLGIAGWTDHRHH